MINAILVLTVLRSPPKVVRDYFFRKVALWSGVATKLVNLEPDVNIIKLKVPSNVVVTFIVIKRPKNRFVVPMVILTGQNVNCNGGRVIYKLIFLLLTMLHANVSA